MMGFASPSFFVSSATSSAGRNKRPFFWKNGPPPASMIERKSSFCSDNFWMSAAVACDAKLGGRRVDDRQDGFFLGREELVECRLTLAPWQLLGDELVDVGIDGEMAGRVDAADKTQKYRNANDLIGMTGAKINRRNDRLLQHALSWRLCDWA